MKVRLLNKNLFIKKLIAAPFFTLRTKIFIKRPKGVLVAADNLLADEIYRVKHLGLTH